MPTVVAIACSVVIVLCSLALAYHGSHTVLGEFRAVLDAVDRIVTSAGAYAKRIGAARGVVIVELAMPSELYAAGDKWMVAADTERGRVTPSLTVVSRSSTATQSITVKFEVSDAGGAEVPVNLTVLDVATLEPLAVLHATVPRMKSSSGIQRLGAALRRALSRRSVEGGRL